MMNVNGLDMNLNQIFKNWIIKNSHIYCWKGTLTWFVAKTEQEEPAFPFCLNNEKTGHKQEGTIFKTLASHNKGQRSLEDRKQMKCEPYDCSNFERISRSYGG